MPDFDHTGEHELNVNDSIKETYVYVEREQLTDAELGRRVRSALMRGEKVDVLGKPGEEKINAIKVVRLHS